MKVVLALLTALGGLVMASYQTTLDKALFHLWISLGRFLPPLLLGLFLGLALAWLIRRRPVVETWLTPWLLSLQALPWLLIIPAVNIIPYIALDDRTIFLLITLILVIHLGSALGFRKQPDRSRSERVRYGFELALAALLIAELFSRKSGVGAELRFYALYWTPLQVVVFAALSVGLWGLVQATVLGLNWLWPKLFRQLS